MPARPVPKPKTNFVGPYERSVLERSVWPGFIGTRDAHRAKAARITNHASTRTTQLYDRRNDEVSLDEVERILI